MSWISCKLNWVSCIKLNSKFDEFDKLYAVFDELDKLHA